MPDAQRRSRIFPFIIHHSSFIISLAHLSSFIIFLALVSGCANAQHYRGVNLATTRPSSLILVPSAAQDGKNDCGYAALASVAMYYRVPGHLLVDGQVPRTYRGKRLSAEDLKKMAGMLELKALGYQGDADDLRSNVAKGRPVLVLLNQPPRLANFPQFESFFELAAAPFVIPHWVVVAGFTADGRVILHDPRNGLIAMTLGEFNQLWQKRSRLSVLVFRQ